jgi:hypothetical protein
VLQSCPQDGASAVRLARVEREAGHESGAVPPLWPWDRSMPVSPVSQGSQIPAVEEERLLSAERANSAPSFGVPTRLDRLGPAGE